MLFRSCHVAAGDDEGLHRCLCDPTHFTTPEECVHFPARPYDRCGTQAHCSAVPNTACSPVTKVCACLTGFDLSPDGNACVYSRLPEYVDDPCETSAHCANVYNTECVQDGFGYGYCRCRIGTVASESRRGCLPVVRSLGEPSCQENVQCTAGVGEGAYCDRVCACGADYVESSGRDRCLRVRQACVKCLLVLTLS